MTTRTGRPPSEPSPSTRFGVLRNGPSSDIVNTSIDWDRLVRGETRKVTEWVIYLHANDYHEEIHDLVAAVGRLTHRGKRRPPEWDALAKSHLPLIVIRILVNPYLFCDCGDHTDRNRFFHDDDQNKKYANSIFYGTQFLDLLSFCVEMILIGMTNRVSTREDSQIVNVLTTNIGPFSEAMWKRRHLVPRSAVQSFATIIAEDHDIPLHKYASSSLNCMDLMMQLYERNQGISPPPSTYASYCILYTWTYTRQAQDTRPTMEHLRRMIHEHVMQIPGFITNYFRECHSGYRYDLATKINFSLRDDTIVGEEALTVVKVCGTLACTEPIVDQQDLFEERKRFIPSLLASCQRQLCGCSIKEIYTTHALFTVNTVFTSRRMFGDSIDRYGGEMNMISMVALVLLHGTEEGNEKNVEMGLNLLEVQRIFARRSPTNPELVKRKADLLRTSSWAWNRTLKSLLNVKPNGPTHVRLKNRVVNAWRKYGLTLGLKEGEENTTLPRPTISSQPYWMMEKRCFWDGCPCSVVRPSHHVRACKGCFQVMYCNAICQQRDWDAGHKVVCGKR
ncbi:hypothetical protein BXZ70DRAFT_947962 [Cristinia sonorae]|uniref:MYND-type domain-containing protein n=1 Tax=Cristinia sonorae TaxID=1940300 RepID=A0A8K0UKG2_9AGAR|nr:hypothetical protein BXZ70DRAFT_947962 [Cristinia sonorae]